MNNSANTQPALLICPTGVGRASIFGKVDQIDVIKGPIVIVAAPQMLEYWQRQITHDPVFKEGRTAMIYTPKKPPLSLTIDDVLIVSSGRFKTIKDELHRIEGLDGALIVLDEVHTHLSLKLEKTLNELAGEIGGQRIDINPPGLMAPLGSSTITTGWLATALGGDQISIRQFDDALAPKAVKSTPSPAN